jgi:hypothetical protein
MKQAATCSACCLLQNMEAICSSETSVNFHRTVRLYIPKDRTLRSHWCENLKSDNKKAYQFNDNHWTEGGSRINIRNIVISDIPEAINNAPNVGVIFLLIGWWIWHHLVKRSDPINNRFGLKGKWCGLPCGMRQQVELGTDTHPEFGWIDGTICSLRTRAASNTVIPWRCTLVHSLSAQSYKKWSSTSLYLLRLWETHFQKNLYLPAHLSVSIYQFIYSSTCLFI